MIFLISTQGIGTEWADRRYVPAREYRILSNGQHPQRCQFNPDTDRVIEIGPGPREPHYKRIMNELGRRGWPEARIEWEPMIPTIIPTPMGDVILSSVQDGTKSG